MVSASSEFHQLAPAGEDLTSLDLTCRPTRQCADKVDSSSVLGRNQRVLYISLSFI